MKYYHLKVKEIIQETSDTITISFWHPLSEMIKYQSGQFLTLIIPIDDKKHRRSYSMSSSPQTDASPAVTVKRVANGLISNWLNDNIKIDDFVEVAEPMGNFVLTPDASKSRTIVLIGAGSGITPLISMAKTVLKAEANSRVVLLYGNRNEESIIFRKQLNELTEKYGTKFTVVHSLSQPPASWSGQVGRLSKAQIISILETNNIQTVNTEFYLCGPDGLMQEAQAALATLGVNNNQIHRESFFNETPPQANEDTDNSLSNRQITVVYEGQKHQFEVAPHQTILEAALELDIDLPYSCQAGMCTACMGKCVSGKVQLDEKDGLTENELKAGFILTCVAHPLTNDVVIEID